MITIHDHDWRFLLTPIMHRAGEIILSYRKKTLERHKKTAHEFVTQADLDSERYLIKALGDLVPDAAFISEESHISLETNKKYCWVIDPLDGTTNFAHGIPYFCVSVALTINNEPVVGVVYYPLLQELFFAQKGKGSWLGDMRLSVSNTSLSQGVIGIGLPYVHSASLRLLRASESIIKNSFAVRHTGAVALDMALVAAGRLDGILFSRLTWWDIAAGTLLIQEAGGTVTDFDGKPVTPLYTSYVAGGKEIHEKLVANLKSA